jgi:hypothetical protein
MGDWFAEGRRLFHHEQPVDDLDHTLAELPVDRSHGLRRKHPNIITHQLSAYF